MKRILYNKGELVGANGIKYLEESNPYIPPKGKPLRVAIFECPCNKIFISPICKVKWGHKKDCGCGTISQKQLHGLSNTSIRRLWVNVKQRCLNKNFPYYKYYGGRGITLHEPWVHNFISFYNYISSLPNFGVKGLTLDRVNNNGNYEPNNLRWATMKEQANNKRPRNTINNI